MVAFLKASKSAFRRWMRSSNWRMLAKAEGTRNLDAGAYGVDLLFVYDCVSLGGYDPALWYLRASSLS
jgi:hypothetical protein